MALHFERPFFFHLSWPKYLRNGLCEIKIKKYFLKYKKYKKILIFTKITPILEKSQFFEVI